MVRETLAAAVGPDRNGGDIVCVSSRSGRCVICTAGAALIVVHVVA